MLQTAKSDWSHGPEDFELVRNGFFFVPIVLSSFVALGTVPLANTACITTVAYIRGVAYWELIYSADLFVCALETGFHRYP